jgi:hypothetical protein
MSSTITESSGNVFVDLGFEPAEALILQMRAKLMSDLREFIQWADSVSDGEATEDSSIESLGPYEREVGRV